MRDHFGVERRPGVSPTGPGRLSWALLLLYLLLAAACAGVAKLTGQPGWVIGVAAVVGAIALPAGNTARTLLEERRKSQGRILALTAGPTGLVRDVAPREVGVHRAVREDVPYIARDVEDVVVDRLRLERRVLIAGPAMLGKTRLALSAAKTAFGDYAFHKPVDGKAVRDLLGGGAKLERVLLWLDDLERFTDTGLIAHDLQRLLDTGTVIVVATIRASEYAKLQPTGEEIKPPGWEAAAWFNNPIWLKTWSEAELDRLTRNTLDQSLIAEARKYGLSGYLGGAPLVDRQLAIGETQNPIGHALVQVAVDWGRVGMTQPISTPTIATLLPYYATLKHRTSLEEQVKMGLDWATQPLSHTVTLLAEEAGGLRATDLVMDRLANSTRPVPVKLWKLALEAATPSESMAIGYRAYDLKETLVAREAWEKAAAAGDTSAMFNLGNLHANRLDPRDLDQARRWYQRAAESGDAAAMFNLGNLLVNRHHPPELEEARGWYQRAAEAGHIAAMFNLGYLLASRLDPPDLDQARRWYQRAAKAGHTAAMFNLARLLADRLNPPQPVQARHWYKGAAEAGITGAMFNFGLLLANRLDPPDLDEARHWYLRAAQAGDTGAMFNLGNLLANRLDPPDLAEARRWYLRAAQAGDADAMFKLGVLLEDRLDWPDLAEARRWYLRAAGAGHANAARRLSRLRVPEDKGGRSRRRRRNQAK
jgi:TPR repeat protein